MVNWYIWDERDGDETRCEHCNKKINGSKYYILSNELGDKGKMFTIGSGCVKKFTGKTIKEIKADTNKAIMSQ
jgi:hypothetical protein